MCWPEVDQDGGGPSAAAAVDGMTMLGYKQLNILFGLHAPDQ